MDPERSTEAALRYLKVLNRRFKNWELALAAYNCGPGNVNRAIRRSGGKRTFWGIYRYLPRETRSYIPQFQAIMYVLRYAEEHNLILEEPAYPMAYEKVDMGKGYSLENLARHTGLCVEDLEYLNPSLKRKEVPDFGKVISLNVPQHSHRYITDNKEWIVDSLTAEKQRYLAKNPAMKTDKPLYNATYRVRSGDVLGKIAQKYGVSVSQLKSWNGLYSNTIRIGQVLHIQHDNATFEKNIASSAAISTNSNGGKMYTVQPGDSLWLISRKLEGVTIEQLKKLNNLNNNQIKPGQKLIIG
jgi:membrane-bound lytic murein transglycosylase D